MKYRIVFNGVVQGVGCRAIVRGVARGMHLGGVARNIKDGGVEIYVEVPGEKVVEQLIEKIKQAAEETTIDIMKVSIYPEQDYEFLDSKPPSDYSTFRIE